MLEADIEAAEARDDSNDIVCGVCISFLCMVANGNEDPNSDFLKINEHFCKVAALNRKIVMEWKTMNNEQ